jgi:hypothetical protein
MSMPPGTAPPRGRRHDCHHERLSSRVVRLLTDKKPGERAEKKIAIRTMMAAIWTSCRRNAFLRNDVLLGINGFAEFLLGDAVRFVGADDFSGAHDQDAVALMQNLIGLVRNEQNRQTASCERIDNLKDSAFAPMSTPM